MTSKTGYQTVPVHIMPNVQRRKGNQRVKFCQLIRLGYNMRNILLKNSTQNVWRRYYF